MMNELFIEIGGKKRRLKFNIGTLNVLNDAFGIDPLKFKAESDNWRDLLPYAAKITYAALVSAKEETGFTIEQVSLWIEDLSVADLTDIVTAYNNIFNRAAPSVNGEVGKDTQPVLG